LVNADADAVAHGDLIAHACYPVLSAWIVAQQGRMHVPVTGAFGTFQRGRDVYGTVGAGIPVELQIGCAALVIDTQAMILKLATIGGL
jgi:ABC-type dipeptide/oligopeptide/nickel transport system permease subunit